MTREEKKFVLLKDVVIPAGTVLERACNEHWWFAYVECTVWMGTDATADFLVNVSGIEDMPKDLITEIK